jgi:hypothetical protein
MELFQVVTLNRNLGGRNVTVNDRGSKMTGLIASASYDPDHIAGGCWPGIEGVVWFLG